MAVKKNPSMHEAYKIMASENGLEVLNHIDKITQIRQLRKDRRRLASSSMGRKEYKRFINNKAQEGLTKMSTKAARTIWNNKYKLRVTYSNGLEKTFKAGQNVWIKDYWAEPLGKKPDRYYVEGNGGSSYFSVTTDLEPNFKKYLDIHSYRTGKVVATAKLEVIPSWY